MSKMNKVYTCMHQIFLDYVASLSVTEDSASKQINSELAKVHASWMGYEDITYSRAKSGTQQPLMKSSAIRTIVPKKNQRTRKQKKLFGSSDKRTEKVNITLEWSIPKLLSYHYI